MAQAKELPIGIQTFSKIRDPKSNFIYVDKTDLAHSLVRKPGYYFISRPRRFGKSLFLDTLSEIFKGSKELFEGLNIYDKWDWSEKYPVIKIDFTVGGFNSLDAIKKTIGHNLTTNSKELNLPQVDFDLSIIGIQFTNLIKAAHDKYNQKVVILIDEYDKPILDNITNKATAAEAREVLRTFYSAIKSNDTYLQFVFITGVSKFSKLNLFSGLNNLVDITLNQTYATITGYTQHDLETVFSDYISGLDLQEVKRWYNGYNYLGEPVYNPYDILLFFFNNNQFSNYWWQTGNPAFLIEKLKEAPHFLPNLETILVTEEVLNTFDIENMNLVALLWQTGYLTFDKTEGDHNDLFYRMKVPNLEVQKSINQLFFDYLCNIPYHSSQIAFNVKNALKAANLDDLAKHLKSLFAAIPYNNHVKNNIANFEGYYASVIFAFLSSLGYSVRAEDPTNEGRIDMTLIGPDQIFILEFKVDMPAEAALHQIKTKKYFEKYAMEGKAIYLIGVQFSSEERNVVGFEWEVFA